MEVRVGVLREPRKEELEESVHVFARLQTPVNFGSAWVLVGESGAGRLINEENVKVLVPAVWVLRNVLSSIRDSTRSEPE